MKGRVEMDRKAIVEKVGKDMFKDWYGKGVGTKQAIDAHILELLDSADYFPLLAVYEAAKSYRDLKQAYEDEADEFYRGVNDMFPSDLEESMKEALAKLLAVVKEV
jgi:hypothetical protein